MKAKLISKEGKEGKEINLPEQFLEEFRPDLIKRAVLAIQSHRIQRTGVKPRAGLRSSAYLSKRRKRYRGTYGPGRSRTPRKIHTRRGLHFYYVGAIVPNTVGGRVAHPPKATKDWNLKINVKERRKATRSAIAATMDAQRVTKRGHKSKSIVLESGFETINKTKEFESLLKKIGFEAELQRTAIKKIRAGKGKNRGRPYKKKKGPLLVVSEKCPVVNAARNVQGVDVCNVKDLNVELLAPGTDAGRVTIWSNKAIEVMQKERLFY
jgi:large subunit ribosomal protein L4e